jgi:tetrahydromethanopterin S-methyltransferase subunit G
MTELLDVAIMFFLLIGLYANYRMIVMHFNWIKELHSFEFEQRDFNRDINKKIEKLEERVDVCQFGLRK